MAKYKAYLLKYPAEEQKPVLQIIKPHVGDSTKTPDNTDSGSLILKAPPVKNIGKNTTTQDKPPIWENTFPQGSPEARRESLNQVLQALYNSATERGGGIPAKIKSYTNLNQCEDAINTLWQIIINGNANINEFSDYMESVWTPALVAANQIYRDALAVEVEERFCIMNESTI